MADAPEVERTQQTSERLRLERLAALASQPDRPETMTFEEFLAWADEDCRAEWVEGKLVMPSPASSRHQDIQRFLLYLLGLYVAAKDAGKVIQAPFLMRLPHSGREPDLLYITREHLDREKATYLDGPADLAIEIISPDSVSRDQADKLKEYREGGVREYWLINPLIGECTFFQLDAAGRYRKVAPDANGIYRSRALPGFWLDVQWLWQTPSPNVIRTIKLIDTTAYRRYAGE